MITIHPYSRRQHYEVLCGYWKAHDFPPPAAVFLPALGVVAMDGQRIMAAGWCYLDNSVPVAKLEWLVANPDASPFESVKAIMMVTDFLQKRISQPDLNYQVMLTTCHQAGLVRLMEKQGFIKTDEGMTHMVYVVNPEARAAALADTERARGDAVCTDTILETGL